MAFDSHTLGECGSLANLKLTRSGKWESRINKHRSTVALLAKLEFHCQFELTPKQAFQYQFVLTPTRLRALFALLGNAKVDLV